MGTNFYAEAGDHVRHLGKRSAGWTFTFHPEPEFSSFDGLVGWLESTPCEIFDEYGQVYNKVEFATMARSWGQPDGQSATSDHGRGWKDERGFTWLVGDWS